MRKSNYHWFPFVSVTDPTSLCFPGWDKIAPELQRAIRRGRVEKPILVVECYPGVDELAILNELKSRLAPKFVVHAAGAHHSPEKIGNLGAENKPIAANLKYKRAFFVDWRVADRWKRPLISRWDYVLDTNNPTDPKLADAGDVRAGMREAVTRPFRLVPFCDFPPWSGQPLDEVCDPDRNVANFGYSLDCAPEDNSLLLGFGETRLEIPAVDLLFYQSRALLGEEVYARFGDGFPIRFNILDNMGAGNYWFQVHPLPNAILLKRDVIGSQKRCRTKPTAA